MKETGDDARLRSLRSGESRRELVRPVGGLDLDATLAWLVAAETETKKGKKVWTLQTSFGSEGSGVSELKEPAGVFVSADGLTAFVADYGNARISVWTRSSATSTDWGNQTTFGTYGRGTSRLERPEGVFVSRDGLTAWIADQRNDRIVRFARLVGRDALIAGTDCGLGGRVHPQLAWAKLQTLAQGAALATKQLWS